MRLMDPLSENTTEYELIILRDVTVESENWHKVMEMEWLERAKPNVKARVRPGPLQLLLMRRSKDIEQNHVHAPRYLQ